MHGITTKTPLSQQMMGHFGTQADSDSQENLFNNDLEK
jgi:hypothetical protein